MTKLYGTTPAEQSAADTTRAREIAAEILRYGVTNEQVKHLIYLLALELDEREHMLRITEAAKDALGTLDKSSVEQPGLITE